MWETAALNRAIERSITILEQIQDVCRERRKALGMSSQELAERSGIPLSTVNNFFAAASKLPSAATAGAICAILGVSMDAVYGIKEPPDAALTRQLEREREEYAQQLAHEREKNALLLDTIDAQQRTISNLQRSVRNLRSIIFALLVILTLVFIYGITLDILNPGMGLFRGGM